MIRVGDVFVTTAEIWDYAAKVAIPPNVEARVTATTRDMPFGYAVVVFDWPDTTPEGVLMNLTGHNAGFERKERP